MEEDKRRGGKGEGRARADSASPATRARQHSPGSRSPPFAIPPLFHYSGMDVGIKAVDERSKNFNSIKEEPKRCSLVPSSFLSSRVVYKRTKEAREKERDLLSPSSPLKNCLDEIPEIHPTPPPSSVLHLISLLSSNYRNKIIISRRFLPPLPSPISLRKRGFARISGCRGMS